MLQRKRNNSVLFIQTPEEEDDEEKEQDKANRTARVQPTPQTRDALAESPNTPNADRRKYETSDASLLYRIRTLNPQVCYWESSCRTVGMRNFRRNVLMCLGSRLRSGTRSPSLRGKLDLG